MLTPFKLNKDRSSIKFVQNNKNKYETDIFNTKTNLKIQDNSLQSNIKGDIIASYQNRIDSEMSKKSPFMNGSRNSSYIPTTLASSIDERNKKVYEDHNTKLIQENNLKTDKTIKSRNKQLNPNNTFNRSSNNESNIFFVKHKPNLSQENISSKILEENYLLSFNENLKKYIDEEKKEKVECRKKITEFVSKKTYLTNINNEKDKLVSKLECQCSDINVMKGDVRLETAQRKFKIIENNKSKLSTLPISCIRDEINKYCDLHEEFTRKLASAEKQTDITFIGKIGR